MAFRVEITARAKQNADAILEWLESQHSGDAGLRWFRKLEEAIASLAAFPVRCNLAPENSSFAFQVRPLLFGNSPHVYRYSSRLMTIRFMYCTSDMAAAGVWIRY